MRNGGTGGKVESSSGGGGLQYVQAGGPTLLQLQDADKLHGSKGKATSSKGKDAKASTAEAWSPSGKIKMNALPPVPRVRAKPMSARDKVKEYERSRELLGGAKASYQHRARKVRGAGGDKTQSAMGSRQPSAAGILAVSEKSIEQQENACAENANAESPSASPRGMHRPASTESLRAFCRRNNVSLSVNH